MERERGGGFRVQGLGFEDREGRVQDSLTRVQDPGSIKKPLAKPRLGNFHTRPGLLVRA